jgi:hypothetical protein
MNNLIYSVSLFGLLIATAADGQVAPMAVSNTNQIRADIPAKKIVWNATNLKDLITGKSSSHSCYFITEGLQNIEWVQGDGTVVNSFLVNSATQDTNGSPGRLVSYDIILKKLTGRIDILRNGDVTTVTIDLWREGKEAVHNEYLISNIEISPL